MPKTPKFDNEQDEAEFWDTHDATDFLDETVPVELNFIDTRPRKILISLRVEPDVIEKVRTVAAKKGIGYQTLMRMWVMERLEQEAMAEQRTASESNTLPDQPHLAGRT